MKMILFILMSLISTFLPPFVGAMLIQKLQFNPIPVFIGNYIVSRYLLKLTINIMVSLERGDIKE